MPMGNPRRGVGQEALRVQEFTGGFNGREMVGDYDVNPNENADGLSHHSQEGAMSESFREQIDAEARRKKALREMSGELPHVSVKPEEIADTLNSTPQTEAESMLAEAGTGLDMGTPSGIAASNGGQVGPIRREGPGLLFGRSMEIVEDIWGLLKASPADEAVERKTDAAAAEMQELADRGYETGHRMLGGFIANRRDGNELSQILAPMVVSGKHARDNPMDDDLLSGEELHENFYRDGEPDIQEAIRQGAENTRQQIVDDIGSEDIRVFVPTPPHVALKPKDFHPQRIAERAPPLNELRPGVGQFGAFNDQSISWQDKNASADRPTLLSDIIKAKRKVRGRKYEDDDESEEEEKKGRAKKRRKRKRKMKQGKKESSRDIKGKTARRAAAAEQSLDRGTKRQAFSPRRMFSGNPRASGVPLRIRDPVAYQRKLANERMRREQGALPRDITVHRDTRGIQGKIQTIGREPSGTKFNVSAPKGTSMRQFKKPKNADSMGSLVHDPLAGDPLKASPENDNQSKRGAQASPDRASDPTGPTEVRDEERAAWRFEDPSTLLAAGVVGKR